VTVLLIEKAWKSGEKYENNVQRPIMPFNPKFTITPKINKALVEIERVRGFLDALKVNSRPVTGLDFMSAPLDKTFKGEL
jgi:hypothetical protein